MNKAINDNWMVIVNPKAGNGWIKGLAHNIQPNEQ